MKYVSTRMRIPGVSFSAAMMQALAPDGGLFVPEKMPVFTPDKIAKLFAAKNIQRLGSLMLADFIPELAPGDLLQVLEESLNFPVPLVHLQNNIWLLELFHGPTLAFKDVGARFMARILPLLAVEAFSDKQGTDILVATSGDTGSAVVQGFFGVPQVRVHVLYPAGRISRLQELQMTTLGGNIFPVEVAGSFDDCQHLVKTALQDRELAQKSSFRFSSANSINIARLLPQMIYHAWSVLQLQRNFQQSNPLVCVPSGNFGNLVAAVYAGACGISINNFIAATNCNRTFAEYLSDGIYVPRASVKTLSNAMDVGAPGNLERLRYYYHDSVTEMRKQLSVIVVDDAQTLRTIREVYEQTGYYADPHTAVAIAAALGSGERERPVIVAATAHPAKFPEVMQMALGEKYQLPVPAALRFEGATQKQVRKISPDYAVFCDILLHV